MKTIFTIEEDISLELSQHIYDFMTRLKQYEIMILGKKFKVELPPLEESPLQPLLKPFIDDRFPLDEIREFAWVIGVDANYKALCIDLLSIGDVNQTLVYPWMAFRSTNFFAVSGIYLVHNHPSGDPTPSEADIALTKAILDGAIKLRRPLLDHIIMGNNCYYSFGDEAVLERLQHEVEQEIIGVAKLRKIINKKDAELSQKDEINGRLVDELDEKNAEIERLRALLDKK